MKKLELTIEEMNAMPVKQLKAVFKVEGIELPKNQKKEGLQRTLKRMCADYKSGHEKTLDKTNSLREKKDKTQHEFVLLANNLIKIEDKTLSQVYKRISKAEGELKSVIKSILGKTAMPTFKEFAQKMKPNENKLYSVWSGLLNLKKFNVIEKTKKKVARQNKAEAKKALLSVA
jgi:hypothetical protein